MKYSKVYSHIHVMFYIQPVLCTRCPRLVTYVQSEFHRLADHWPNGSVLRMKITTNLPDRAAHLSPTISMASSWNSHFSSAVKISPLMAQRRWRPPNVSRKPRQDQTRHNCNPGPIGNASAITQIILLYWLGNTGWYGQRSPTVLSPFLKSEICETILTPFKYRGQNHYHIKAYVRNQIQPLRSVPCPFWPPG